MVKYWNKKFECMSRDKLEKLQSERLIKKLKYIAKNVPYYAEKLKAANIDIKDISSIKDLYKLPFMTSEDIKNTYPFGLFAAPMKDIIRLHTSSGTTGKQKVVGYTSKDIDMWKECCARAFTAIGVDNSDFIHISYGYGLFTGGMGLHYGAEEVGATVIPVGVGNTERQITVINDFGSTCICCTPSYALFLADTMEKEGITSSNLKKGFFGAEIWSEEMRKEIENKLHIKAYDIYGLSEILGPGVAYECETQSGMHLNEDNFIAEIINPNTLEVLADNQEGELVITTITKEGFPLIRYRTGDISIINREKCKCGRTFLRIGKPMGRTDDMSIVRGVNVFPGQVESVLSKYDLHMFQLLIERIKNRDMLTVLIFTKENIEEKEREIKKSIESVLGISVDIKIQNETGDILEGNKLKRVIDNR